MRTPLILLKFIGKAVLNAAGAGIAGDLVVDVLPEVAQDVWDWWSRDRNDQQRRDDVQALAQARPDEIREAVAAVVQEVAAERPPEDRKWLTTYLTHVPAVTRQSLRRPSDPTGTIVPPTRTLQGPDDLLPLLPTRLPRFKPADRPLPGVDWELVELLGVGGFGEVWKARNPHLASAQPVALKFCLDPSAATVLCNEAAVLDRVMRQGRHRGIVTLHHTYLSADPPCLEYEYVAGGDLAGRMQAWSRSRGGVKPQQATALVRRLAEIVGFAHRLRPPIVHRDLKPANVLLEPREGDKFAPRVADFGIGGVATRQAIQQTRQGTTAGRSQVSVARGSYTPLYASPQQMQGGPPDPRDDVFALGVIWYQLLTGNIGTGRPGGTRWQQRLLERGLSAREVGLLAACFEDEPEDRPADAAALAEQLAALGPSLHPPAPPAAPPPFAQPAVNPITEPPRPQESSGRAAPPVDVPAATPATAQKTTGQLDPWGEPLKMVPTGKWEAGWRRANAELLREWDLIYGLMTTPRGGRHHRPGPRFVSKESLKNRPVFIRKGSSSKPVYVEIDKDKNEIDWERGLVRLPVTPL